VSWLSVHNNYHPEQYRVFFSGNSYLTNLRILTIPTGAWIKDGPVLASVKSSHAYCCAPDKSSGVADGEIKRRADCQAVVYALGAPRYASARLPTRYTFTGQYSYTDDLATPAVTEGFGLMFYNARWYDPYLNRWAQPDSIIPDQYNPLDWDRYAYARSNPLKYIDPDGHFPWLVLIGVLIYMATLPGDTGPYEVNPTTAAVGEAGLRMADPVDWFYTGVECLSGNCSGADIALGLLPFVNGGMDNAVDAAKALDSTGALAHADDVVETAGQFHHIFSNKIVNALNRHETLGGVFNRDDFIVQGLDAASHKGYQAWHRAYDQEVVNWLTDNPRATPEQFLSYLRDLYKRTEIDKRFPQAWQQLQMAIEEME